MPLRPPAPLALLLWAAPAAAHVEAQVGVSAESGYTDNALGAATEGAPEADVFFNLRPSVTVTSEAARLLSRSTATLVLSRFVQESQASSIAATGTLALDYDLAKTVRTALALNAGYTDVASVAPQLGVDAVPLGGARYFEAGLGATVAKDFSARLRAVEEARAAVHLPIGDDARARSVSVDERAGMNLSLARDAFAARLGLGGDFYEALEGEASGRETYRLSLTGEWLHEGSPAWSWGVDGGAAAVLSAGSASVEPLARGRVQYAGRDTQLFAQVAQSVSANALVARTLASSSVSVGLNRRFGMGGAFSVSATAGGAIARAVGEGGGQDVDSAQATAELAWAALENLSVTVHYDVLYQVADDPVMDRTRLLRNAVRVGLAATWPTRRPSILPPPGLGLRVRESEEREADERAGTQPVEEEAAETPAPSR